MVEPRRILLVEDHADSRELLRALCEHLGHHVAEASDGHGAIEEALVFLPDVAFIDIGLPVMNGFEVAQQIRKRPELDNVMLVALSGYGNHSDVDAAMSAGFVTWRSNPAFIAASTSLWLP